MLLFLEIAQDHSLGGWIVKILLNALALLAGGRLLSGIHLTDFGRAVIVALVLALLNATLGAFLSLLALPLTLLTFGLFGFVIDALVIMTAGYFLKGFTVDGFWPALLLALLLALFNLVLHSIHFG